MTEHLETPVPRQLYENPAEVLESYRQWTASFLEPYTAINDKLGFASDAFEVHFRDPSRRDTIVIGRDQALTGHTAFNLEYSNEEAYQNYLEEERIARIKRLGDDQHPSEVRKSLLQVTLYDPGTIALPEWQLRDTCAAASLVHSKLQGGLGRSAVGHLRVWGYPLTIDYSAKKGAKA